MLLQLRMHGTCYTRVCRRPVRMNWMHRTQSDHTSLNLLSLVTQSNQACFDHPWNLHKAQRGSKNMARQTGESRSRIAFSICTNQVVYPTTAAKARNWYQRWLWWKGTRILVWKTFHLEKQDFLFICSVALRNFPLEQTKKVAFHLLSNRNFWKLLVVFDLRLLIVNEFLSITSLEIGASLASMRSEIKPAAKGKLNLKKKR